MDRANALPNSADLPTAQAVTTAAAAGTAAPPIGHSRNPGKAAAAALQARVEALRAENERLERQARALRDLRARDSTVLSL